MQVNNIYLDFKQYTKNHQGKNTGITPFNQKKSID